MQPDDRMRDRSRLRTSIAPPPWDELREQRVLTRILEQRRAGQVASPSSSRARPVGWALAAACLCAVVALVFLGRGRLFPSSGAVATTSSPPAVSAPASSAGASGSTIALVDGSQVHLLREADVQVEEERPKHVRIAQSHGVVRYEVSHDPSREFTVRAANTTVRVRGTIFTVDVRASSVEVRVERGRVEVDDGARTHELVDGEALEVPNGAAALAAPADAAADDSPTAAVESAATVATPAPAAQAPSVAVGPSAASLQASADAARLSGNNAEAAASLEKLVRLYPSDPRVPNVLFTLGRVERARGNHAASARAFDRCFKAAPAGSLAEDAFAETAVSWSSAGRTAESRAQAGDYLTRWPVGPNAARMRDLLGP